MNRPSLGAAVGHVWRTFRADPGRCLLVAAPPAVLIGVAATILDGLSAALADARPGFGQTVAVALAVAGAGGTFLLAGLVAIPVAAVGLAYMAAATVRGEPVDPQRLWRVTIDRGPAAVAAFGLSILVVAALPIGLGAAALATALWAGPAAGGAVGILAISSLVFAFVWWVRLSLAVPAAAEGAGRDGEPGPMAALEASVNAVRGGFWWVFALLALAAIAGGFLSGIVALPFAFASPASGGASAVAAAAGQSLGTAVSVALTGVAAGVAWAMRTATVLPPPQEQFDFQGAPGG